MTLAVPDPRTEAVPAGWWDMVVRPEIEAAETWEQLDEVESKLAAIVAFVEALGGSVVEYEKALRIVEKRRGELLGPKRQGARSDLSPASDNFEVSRQTISKWKTLAEHWDSIVYPYLLEAEDRRQVTQTNLLRLIKQRIAADKPPNDTPPDDDAPTTFTTLVIDPPWQYDNRATRGAAEDHYPTMSMDELSALELPAADNAHLYLWVTNGFLREGFALLDAWGFTYKACLTWCKPQIGMGNYFRNATEHVYFAVRGSLPTEANNISTWFVADRTRHSAKPEQFYDIVEKSSPGPYMEMFARRRRLGWHVWGNEA